MAAEAKPMQGSLFEDSIAVSPAPKTSSTGAEKFKDEFSDEELTKDAQLRPRSKSKANSEPNNPFLSATESEKCLTPQTDLEALANHTQVDLEQLTPVLRHYVELKAANPERILLYRLGDFFECFFEDAIKLSEILELTLTGKEGGKNIGRVPMAGIPHHAATRYCSELIRKGLSVALCDQLESTPSKGALLKRGITRILTPGTVIEEGMLQARKNNWLAAIVLAENNDKNRMKWGLASADVSTGEFIVMEREGGSELYQELNKLDASEVIWSESDNPYLKDWFPEHIKLTPISKTSFSKPSAEFSLTTHYQLTTIKGIGLNDWPLAIRAAGGLLTYLNNANPRHEASENVNNHFPIPLDLPKLIFKGDALIIDAQTRRNLEITSTQKDGQFHGSLLWAIDRTLTSMGGRCLRRWLEEPLVDVSAIYERQEVITSLVSSRSLRQAIRRPLRAMGDLERLAGRAGAGQAGARDIVAIADGIERLPHLTKHIQKLAKNGPKWLMEIQNIDPDLIDLAQTIRSQLISNPPLSLSEGGLIHDGVDPLLDGIRNQLDDQELWLESQESLERKLSGNSNLRLQYHRTFGYFLSVSKAKASQVPDHWIRRQTLANEERFITPDLKAREGKIFQAKARAAQREYELFCNLRVLVGNQANKIRIAARAIAGLDSLTSLAEVAATNSYCRPEVKGNDLNKNSREINIKGCRHAVVEQLLVEKLFKENDVDLGAESDLIILTGPNASGKSCYLRQIGLVQLLAQIGSWVPANEASLSMADRIFTRVGAVDDLAAGQSTFMVEMAETASILHQATSRSLVLLDEIGRGTATYDGLSIAWAVSEFLAVKIKSRTIFATHYHELNSLESTLDNVANYQVLVKETGDSITFLHEVIPGGASRSYGIEAARLAGVPNDVIQRAKEILLALEKSKTIQSLASESIIPSVA